MQWRVALSAGDRAGLAGIWRVVSTWMADLTAPSAPPPHTHHHLFALLRPLSHTTASARPLTVRPFRSPGRRSRLLDRQPGPLRPRNWSAWQGNGLPGRRLNASRPFGRHGRGEPPRVIVSLTASACHSDFPAFGVAFGLLLGC